MKISRIALLRNKWHNLLLVCPLFFFLPLTTPVFANPQHPYLPRLFASVKDIPLDKRVAAARDTYKQNCRKMDEADAMKCLDELTDEAHKLDDLPLECAVYDMRADYYSVNRGPNPKSVKYFDEGINFADRHRMLLEVGIYQHRKAVYYFLYKDNIQACKYFLLSDDNFRKVGLDNVPDVGLYFSETAGFYYSVGDLANARANLREALQYKLPVARTRIGVITALGLTYRKSRDYNIAMKYFNYALHLSTAAKDSAWIAITNGNIGSVYFLLHQYKKALPLIEADYRESVKYDQIINSAIALLRLVAINIEAGNLKKASLQLDTADKILIRAGNDVLAFRVQYYDLKANVYDKLNEREKSLSYRKQYELVKDSVDKRDNIAAIERVRLQWETDKSRAELSRLKTASEISDLKQNTIIVILIMAIAITGLIYNRQRLKAKKDKELLASEKRLVDEELKYATLALHEYTENLRQKNLLIEEFKMEVERLQLRSDDMDGAKLLEKMTQAHIMTDENWNEFKKLFVRVHPTFIYNLRNQYDNLSSTDMRLLALLKLRLNNRETAGMLGITTDGVKKAKQRLRKKMNIPTEVEIEDILLKL